MSEESIKFARVDILTDVDYESMRDKIKPINKDWWLKTESGRKYVHGTEVITCDPNDQNEWSNIRLLAVSINPIKENEEYQAYGLTWRALNNKYLLSDETIGYCLFESNKSYFESKIRQRIKDWQIKNVR